MDEELKRMVEAILFAAARKLELEEIAKLCHSSNEDVLAVLTEWKAQLDASNSPTMLLQDGTAWKLTVREKYVGIIKKVVTKTELPKGILETLAVVAYKFPVLQSKVVKIRTNKAYDHLAQLENSGFITREKSGRSKLIKLTPKFFEYFDIDPSKLRQKFTSAGDIEKAIEAKEKEIEQLEAAQRKQTEEQLGKPQIVLEDSKKPLEQYPAVEPVKEILPAGVEIFEEKVGDLPVYDVPVESLPPEERPVEEHPHKIHHKKKPAKKHQHAVHHPVKHKLREHHEKEAQLEAPAAVFEEKVEIPEVEDKKESESIQLTPEQKIAKEAEEKAKRLKEKKFEEGKGLYPEGVPPEIQAKIEEKIKKILTGEPKEKENE